MEPPEVRTRARKAPGQAVPGAWLHIALRSGGEGELDLTPMIFGLSMRKAYAQELELTVLVSAQNPSCNPQLLVNAIERYLPEQKPDFARINRLEIYDEQGNPFR